MELPMQVRHYHKNVLRQVCQIRAAAAVEQMMTVQVDFLVYRRLLARDLASMAGRRLGTFNRPVDAFGEVANLGVEAGLYHFAHRFEPGLSRFGDTAVRRSCSASILTPCTMKHVPLKPAQYSANQSG